MSSLKNAFSRLKDTASGIRECHVISREADKARMDGMDEASKRRAVRTEIAVALTFAAFFGSLAAGWKFGFALEALTVQLTLGAVSFAMYRGGKSKGDGRLLAPLLAFAFCAAFALCAELPVGAARNFADFLRPAAEATND